MRQLNPSRTDRVRRQSRLNLLTCWIFDRREAPKTREAAAIAAIRSQRA
jgi:hypothetical protein